MSYTIDFSDEDTKRDNDPSKGIFYDTLTEDVTIEEYATALKDGRHLVTSTNEIIKTLSMFNKLEEKCKRDESDLTIDALKNRDVNYQPILYLDKNGYRKLYNNRKDYILYKGTTLFIGINRNDHTLFQDMGPAIPKLVASETKKAISKIGKSMLNNKIDLKTFENQMIGIGKDKIKSIVKNKISKTIKNHLNINLIIDNSISKAISKNTTIGSIMLYASYEIEKELGLKEGSITVDVTKSLYNVLNNPIDFSIEVFKILEKLTPNRDYDSKHSGYYYYKRYKNDKFSVNLITLEDIRYIVFGAVLKNLGYHTIGANILNYIGSSYGNQVLVNMSSSEEVIDSLTEKQKKSIENMATKVEKSLDASGAFKFGFNKL